MIHYHGGPITPTSAVIAVWPGRHAFISYAYPQQMTIADDVVRSFVLDNGAFSAWTKCEPLDILASADSTNMARNVDLDSRWYGPYVPPSTAQRALVLVDRIEAHQTPPAWFPVPMQEGLLE